MPLAKHDLFECEVGDIEEVSTHMPLARHDPEYWGCYLDYEFLLTCLLRGMTYRAWGLIKTKTRFYSHASCEA